MKRLLITAALALLALPCVAVDETAGTADGLTTRPSTRSREAMMTTASFEKRWERQEVSYKEVGVSEENIQKLRELDQRAFEMQRSGQKLDYRAMQQERQKLLTPEQLEKMKQLRIQQVQRRAGSADANSSPSESVKE